MASEAPEVGHAPSNAVIHTGSGAAHPETQQHGDDKLSLQVEIIKASNLYDADASLLDRRESDPYCICSIKDSKDEHAKVKTHTINNNLNPEWNFSGEIKGFDVNHDILVFEVWDSDFGKDTLLGKAELLAAELNHAHDGIERSLPLKECKHAQGEVVVRISAKEPLQPKRHSTQSAGRKSVEEVKPTEQLTISHGNLEARVEEKGETTCDFRTGNEESHGTLPFTRVRFYKKGKPLMYGEILEMWAGDTDANKSLHPQDIAASADPQDVAASRSLCAKVFAGCFWEDQEVFWECQPVTLDTLMTTAFEFVGILASEMHKKETDSNAFADKFVHNMGTMDCLQFMTPSPPPKETNLLAPSHAPCTDAKVYRSFGSFFKGAPEQQLNNMLELLGKQIPARMEARGDPTLPLYVSTAGYDIAWVHLRLDNVPKYYRFKEYKDKCEERLQQYEANVAAAEEESKRRAHEEEQEQARIREEEDARERSRQAEKEELERREQKDDEELSEEWLDGQIPVQPSTSSQRHSVKHQPSTGAPHSVRYSNAPAPPRGTIAATDAEAEAAHIASVHRQSDASAPHRSSVHRQSDAPASRGSTVHRQQSDASAPRGSTVHRQQSDAAAPRGSTVHQQQSDASAPRGSTVHRQQSDAAAPRGSTVHQQQSDAAGPRGSTVHRQQSDASAPRGSTVHRQQSDAAAPRGSTVHRQQSDALAPRGSTVHRQQSDAPAPTDHRQSNASEYAQTPEKRESMEIPYSAGENRKDSTHSNQASPKAATPSTAASPNAPNSPVTSPRRQDGPSWPHDQNHPLGHTIQNLSHIPTSPRYTFRPPLRDPDSKVPGPGHYTHDGKLRGTTGATVTKRNQYKVPSHDVGPGSYEIPSSIGAGQKNAMHAPQKKRPSKVPGPGTYENKGGASLKYSFGHNRSARENKVPGPGAYDPEHHLVKQRTPRHEMGPDRRNRILRSDKVPGPETYPAATSMGQSMKVGLSMPLQNRMELTPGPGHYGGHWTSFHLS